MTETQGEPPNLRQEIDRLKKLILDRQDIGVKSAIALYRAVDCLVERGDLDGDAVDTILKRPMLEAIAESLTASYSFAHAFCQSRRFLSYAGESLEEIARLAFCALRQRSTADADLTDLNANLSAIIAHKLLATGLRSYCNNQVDWTLSLVLDDQTAPLAAEEWAERLLPLGAYFDGDDLRVATIDSARSVITFASDRQTFEVVERLAAAGWLDTALRARVQAIAPLPRSQTTVPTPNPLRAELISPEAYRHRYCILKRLTALSEPQVDRLIFVVKPPRENIPPATAGMWARLSALLDWAESSIGCGLEMVEEVLEQLGEDPWVGRP